MRAGKSQPFSSGPIDDRAGISCGKIWRMLPHADIPQAPPLSQINRNVSARNPVDVSTVKGTEKLTGEILSCRNKTPL
jgi:hypothetical protein